MLQKYFWDDIRSLVPKKNLFGEVNYYRGGDKSLVRPGRKQATATEDFEFRISYL